MPFDTDGLDLLAGAAEEDGEGVHEEAGVDPCAEDGDAVLSSHGVDALGEGGERLEGERELLAGADDVLPRLDAELQHGRQALELGDGGHDADVPRHARERLGAPDDDPRRGGELGDLGDVAPDLLGVDVNGPHELEVLAGHNVTI